MASVISASTTSATALNLSGDTSGVLQIATGATPTTAITVDASQNVGIGTSSPTSKLTVNGLSTLNGGITLNDYGNIGATSNSAGISLTGGSATNNGGQINLRGGSFSGNANGIEFIGGGTERMRIDGSGNILVANNSSANLTNFTTQALTTASQSGYVKLPNGLILQWGRVSFSGTSASVTFPIAFPTAFWGLAGIPKYGSGISIAFNGESTSGLTLRTSVNTGDYFPYIVYGY